VQGLTKPQRKEAHDSKRRTLEIPCLHDKGDKGEAHRFPLTPTLVRGDASDGADEDAWPFASKEANEAVQCGIKNALRTRRIQQGE